MATAQQQSEQKAQQELAAAQADYQKQIDKRDAAQSAVQVQVAQQIAGVKTTSQAATIIDHYFPSIHPVVVNPAVKSAADALPDAPTPQPTVTLNQGQSINLAQKLLQCDADHQATATCQADTVDIKAQLAYQKKQTMLAEQDATRWEHVAKGGSFWQRVLHKVEWGAVVTAGTVGGYELGKHSH